MDLLLNSADIRRTTLLDELVMGEEDVTELSLWVFDGSQIFLFCGVEFDSWTWFDSLGLLLKEYLFTNWSALGFGERSGGLGDFDSKNERVEW